MATFFDDASLVMIPSGVKESKLYSIKPTDGTGDFTFTRGTDTATRVNSSGLIEKERSNQLLQSNQFDTTWVNSGTITRTSGQSGYDGSSDAWLLTKGSLGAFIRQNISQSGVRTFSVYAKADTSTWLLLVIDGSPDAYQYIDLANGVLGATGSNVDSTIISVGGGWYRCTITGADSYTQVRIYPAEGNGNVSGTTTQLFIQDAQLEQGLVATDYIETTTAAVYEGITDNLPRLDYSGGASCPSLLLEPQRTNTYTNSEYFDDWISNRLDRTANNIISPEGVQNAYKMAQQSGFTTAPNINKGGIAAGTYTISISAKKGSWNHLAISFQGVSYFNLETGSKGTINSNHTATIEDYGNGWYRCAITRTTTTTQTPAFYFAESDNTLTTPDTQGYMYTYGAQLEAGSYPTSYIPTYGTSASRAKDFINQNIQTLTSGLTEGTLFIEFEKPNTGENVDLMRLRGSGNLGRAFIYNNAAGFASNWGTAQNFTLGENTKAAWRLDSLSSGVEFLNGVKGAGGSGTAWSDIRLLRFNAEGNGGVLKIKQILFFPTALTDTECITLTTL